MATTNARATTTWGRTHEGGDAAPASGPFAIAPADQLMRRVASCLLWEPTFYESGDEIADGIRKTALACSLTEIAKVAVTARNDLRLRHVPLFLAVLMARRQYAEAGGSLAAAMRPHLREAFGGDPAPALAPRSVVGDTIANVVQRPDELGELISMYWKEAGITRTQGDKTKTGARIPWQVRRGLQRALRKFDAYQLAKWDEDDKAIKLRDVLFLIHAAPHPKPCVCVTSKGAMKCEWSRLIDGTLDAPDTWEVALSRGDDKKATWTRLLTPDERGRRKMPYMALLQNLRNMSEATVETSLVERALIEGAPFSKALPFRYVAASKAAPQYTDALDKALLAAVKDLGRLPGKTALCIDVSGSMAVPLSAKGTVNRIEAAAALGALIREIGDELRVFAFGTHVGEIPNLRGLGLVKAVMERHARGDLQYGTNIAGVVAEAQRKMAPDRVIVVSDEQGATMPPVGSWTGYVVNCASYGPGMATDGKVTRVNGLSSRLVDWISFHEYGKIISQNEDEGGAE